MEKKFEVNIYGIKVVKACLSCEHSVVNEKPNKPHICRLRADNVDRTDCCDAWKMREGLKNAGKADGQVKCPEYITFFKDKFNENLQLHDEQPKATALPFNIFVRKRFETLYHMDIYGKKLPINI